MISALTFKVRAIARVESTLRDCASAPRQRMKARRRHGWVFEPHVLEGLQSLRDASRPKVDDTPIIDLKPVLADDVRER